MPRFGSGPTNAKIMIVGEAYGDQEERDKEPFVGASGLELNRMLHEVGIMRSECYVTNLVNSRPPQNDMGNWIAAKKKDITAAHRPLRDKYVLPIVLAGYSRLLQEIEMVKPNIIVCLGNSSMWALTGAWGIMKWRGSQLQTHPWQGDLLIAQPPTKLIPSIHPAAVLRQWENRALVINDLRRVKKEMDRPDYSNIPQWRFVLRPSFNSVMLILEELLLGVEKEPLWMDFDLETKLGHIDCFGISWSRLDALCIPFMSKENREGYWTLEEETAIVYKIYKLLTHPNCWVRGQNLLYDAQYTYRHWHFNPNVKQDTMITHHTAFCGLRKSLDFQASLYCDYYVQWKPDKSAWKEGG